MQPKTPISNLAGPLREYINRIEKLAEEKKEVGDAITDIYREAKGSGLDPKMIREMVKLRKITEDQRAEQEFNRDVYMRALGMADDLS